MPVSMVTYEDILAAAQRIKPFIHKTPILTNSYIDELVGRKVYFKCENFQKTGSFKVRGALNAVLKLKEKHPDHPGVASHSSGNHAQALGYAGRCAGLSSSVIVPNNCPEVKQEAIKGYGAKLHFCEPNPTSRSRCRSGIIRQNPRSVSDGDPHDMLKPCGTAPAAQRGFDECFIYPTPRRKRQEVCDSVCKKTGQTYISSHDHPDVIAGQGTMAMEFLEDVPELDAIFATCSGGGMTSGISIATKAIKPKAKVFAVEPKGKDLAKSLAAGQRLWPVPAQYVDTIADGIRVQPIGPNCFSIFLQNVEKNVFTVDDHQISEAMKLIWARMKLIVETSAAATLAALLTEKMKTLDPAIEHIGVILCGGNVDLDTLPWQQGY